MSKYCSALGGGVTRSEVVTLEGVVVCCSVLQCGVVCCSVVLCGVVSSTRMACRPFWGGGATDI